MRYAIFSDIHNHTSALAKVLDHAVAKNVDQFFCLGDVGVDACIELVRQASASTVFGNWEVSNWPILSPANQHWVLNLPPLRQRANFWLTHAAPFWPPHVASLSAFNAHRSQLRMEDCFPYLHTESKSLWKTIATLTEADVPLMFHGHTHRQIAWRFTADNHLERLMSGTIAIRPSDTVVVGIGSVGRPLDRPAASYVIYDDEQQQVEMMRVTMT